MAMFINKTPSLCYRDHHQMYVVPFKLILLLSENGQNIIFDIFFLYIIIFALTENMSKCRPTSSGHSIEWRK
jgi:hypothetical protein